MSEASAAREDANILKIGSLPKARQWLSWVAYHFSELPGRHGWEEASRDAVLGLHHCIAISARRLRGNPIWDFQGSMTDDTVSLEEFATRTLTKFQHLNRKDVPIRFEPLLDCLFGALRQQIRLGREIDTLKKRGKIEVDVFVDTKKESAVEQ